MNLLNYIDRYLGAGMLTLIASGLDLSDARAGLTMSMFIYVYTLVCPVAGWLGDRSPRFPLVAAGVLVWSAATFASGLATGFAALLFARALIGVGEASYSVVTPSLLSDFYPSERRGRALSFFYAAIPLGSALGYVLGGVLGEHLGWRRAFFVAGAPGAALAIGLLFLRDPPRGAFDPRPASGQIALSFRASVRALAQRRSYLYNTLAQTIYTFSIGGLAGWMPTYFVRERHLPLKTADVMFGGIVCLAGFTATLIGGKLSDSLAGRIRAAHFHLSGWALVLSLPFTVVAILSPTPAIFWPSMFVTLFLLFFNTGPLNAAMANVLPADLRGRGFALYTMSIHLFGDAFSPLLIGVASQRIGLKWPVLVTGLLLVPSGLVLLVGRKALARDLDAVAR
jgi:predicted MFS family arabinose efflux permease